ncbi:MAG: hypothetical protein LBG72_07095 [Spirochaetaceae bacterium]|jgi:5-methylcytosine-specific restriction protein A|nr:hypothetical protein [Spirochaetaceae bacterium]
MDFTGELQKIFVEAEQKGLESIEVNSGDLHRRIGGYPGPNHCMPSCCSAMRKMMETGDSVSHSPQKGKGASLTIKYQLPRERNSTVDMATSSNGLCAEFESENALVDFIFPLLKAHIDDLSGIQIIKEGSLDYTLPNDKTLSHKSDILICRTDKRYVSIEVKYRSAVTDQFKCRSFDMLHLKQKYGANILGVLIFLKSTGKGISVEQARDISYPFDVFWGKNESTVNDGSVFKDVFDKIKGFLR